MHPSNKALRREKAEYKMKCRPYLSQSELIADLIQYGYNEAGLKEKVDDFTAKYEVKNGLIYNNSQMKWETFNHVNTNGESYNIEMAINTSKESKCVIYKLFIENKHMAFAKGTNLSKTILGENGREYDIETLVNRYGLPIVINGELYYIIQDVEEEEGYMITLSVTLDGDIYIVRWEVTNKETDDIDLKCDWDKPELLYSNGGGSEREDLFFKLMKENPDINVMYVDYENDYSNKIPPEKQRDLVISEYIVLKVKGLEWIIFRDKATEVFTGCTTWNKAIFIDLAKWQGEKNV